MLLLATILFSKITLGWIALAIIAFGIHLYTKDYYTISIVIGACVTLIAILFGYRGLLTQGLVFLITTVIFAVSFIPMMIQQENKKRSEMQTKEFEMRGRHAVVSETIDNMQAQGTIVIDGKKYMARSASGNVIDKDAVVTVVDRDRHILIVS